MKKSIKLLLTIFLSISLCACSSTDTSATYSTTINNTEFTVDANKGTIFDGENTYHFIRQNDEAGTTTFKITYPDNSTYWQDVSFDYNGHSDDYDENRYVKGETLCEVLSYHAPAQDNPKNFPLIFFLFIVGAIYSIVPQIPWQLKYGWRFKNAKPSDTALTVRRCLGIFALVIAIILIIV